MVFPVIGRIATLLINPATMLKILKTSLSFTAALITIAGLLNLLVIATPKPIKMKVGDMLRPLTQPINTVLIIGGVFIAILAIRELRASR